eukprot:TRINITY_DN3725_c0_g2_i1.p1 TRINITY_DN3725_c0_g2~~TRINITY_DN3725_c0_g2_i1.p1  ORF type:complete len:356 (+),score=126.32 TRINITY_DN3725_c0_g2_i1:129-1196(+)
MVGEHGSAHSSISNLDGQRILAVLEDVIRDFECLCLMGDDSESVIPYLEQLKEAEAGFHEAQGDGDAGMRANLLKQIGRQCIRQLKLDDVGRSELEACQCLRVASMRHLVSVLRQLHEQTFIHLQVTVEEETQRIEQKDELEANLRTNKMNIMTTRHELEREIEARTHDVTVRDDSIRKLQKEIQDIQTNTAQSKQQIEQMTRDTEASKEDSFVEQEKELTRKLETLNKTHDELSLTNAEQEKELRRLKKVKEEKTGQVLKTYDGFMEAMETDINGLTDKYNRETADLESFQKEYSDVMSWKNERNKREDAEKAEEERQRRVEKLKYDSATLIQHAYRKYKDAKSGGKKKKKKKK